MTTDSRIDFESTAKQIVIAARDCYGDFEISRAIAQIYRRAAEMKAADDPSH
jgi:hypothetical protein